MKGRFHELAIAVVFAASTGAVSLAPKSVEAAETAPSAIAATQENPSKTAMDMEKDGYTPKFAREVDRLSREYQERVARGEIPNRPQFIFSPERVGPIVGAKGMGIIVNDGSLIQEQSAKELGLPDTLDTSTAEATLKRLFDGSDMNTWLRNPDGSALTPMQQEATLATLSKDLIAYTKRIEGLKTAPNGDKIMSAFQTLYNGGKETITFAARPSYHRLLINSISIANTIYASPEEQAKLAPILMTQMGEYILLTNKDAGNMVKLSIGPLKYFAPSPKAISANPNFQKIPEMANFKNITEDALAGVNKTNEVIIRNGQRALVRDAELAKEEAKLAE